MFNRTAVFVKSAALKKEFLRQMELKDCDWTSIRDAIDTHFKVISVGKNADARLKARQTLLRKLRAPELSFATFCEGLQVLGINHFDLKVVETRAPSADTGVDGGKGVDGLTAPNLLRM